MTEDRSQHQAWLYVHGWAPSPGSGLAIASDFDRADWIEPRLRPRSYEVGMSAPLGFEAVARIFFPFVGAEIGTGNSGHVTWTEVAERNGRVAHALMEQETIRAPGQDATCLNDLADEQLEALLPILARHTASAHSWFLLWDGFGVLNEHVFRSQPKLRQSMRDYYLLGGALDAYRQFPHDPNFWWPDDRAWCLSTDTDFCWDYLSGSAACIREVLSAPELDAYETSRDFPARSGMDIVNDPNGTVPRMPLLAPQSVSSSCSRPSLGAA